MFIKLPCNSIPNTAGTEHTHTTDMYIYFVQHIQHQPAPRHRVVEKIHRIGSG